MSLNNQFVSVVVPVADGKSAAPRLRELHALLEGLCANYEVVLIDDGCAEPLEKVLARELRELKCLRILTLSRRFGGEAAIRAGLHSAIGDVVVVMELGLDPVSAIPGMLELAGKGHGIVIGVPASRFDEYPGRRLGSRVFHGLHRALTGMELYPGSSWFRAISRSALNALTISLYDTLPFRHATVSVGFNPVVMSYRREAAGGGGPKPSFLMDVRQAVDVILSESHAAPVLMATSGVLGMLLALATLAVTAEGWRGARVVAMCQGGMWFCLFAHLTVLAGYVSRRLMRLQSRPAYIVMNEACSAVEIRDAGRRNVVQSEA